MLRFSLLVCGLRQNFKIYLIIIYIIKYSDKGSNSEKGRDSEKGSDSEEGTDR